MPHATILAEASLFLSPHGFEQRNVLINYGSRLEWTYTCGVSPNGSKFVLSSVRIQL
jgi:hypothetical protein